MITTGSIPAALMGATRPAAFLSAMPAVPHNRRIRRTFSPMKQPKAFPTSAHAMRPTGLSHAFKPGVM